MFIVESQDGKTYRTCLKDFKGIQFFSILQTIWSHLHSPTTDLGLNFTILQMFGCYKWSGSQFHNPTNHLDPTFTRPCSQHIYEICESKTAYES